MLELLIAATGVELGKVVLEKVLDLGQSALEDYTKDFFSDCLHRGIARVQYGTLKKPMAEAIGFFMQRFIKELQINDVPETSLEHHYKGAVKQFVRDKAVRPILGKAFEKDCKQIDYRQLEQIWSEQYQTDGWQFPSDEFDWRRVAKEYVLEVKGIVKADGELRAILNTDLLEDIAQNTAQLSPGFDMATYRESLQCSYGYLKLYTLDSTDRTDNIKLWNMFIEQTVREALPPMRYELPLDLKRQLQEQGELDDLSAEALEHYRQEYFQQPARKVLEAVTEAQWAVILGDPGAGKSTLLQYLALDWVEGKTETLPLLIELREYVLAQSANFLEFLHCGRGADWQFDQQQLHQHLLENPTLVMFDGLDEVFDRPTQSAVVDDIIRFAQQYPQAKVIVTSRIIGYNPERFQHAGFRQFTIQNLDETEIHAFIDRWYDLAMGSDADKVRLKQRLKDAISNSKAIANLADNPLLLTMMAILNKNLEQGLPQNKTDLYNRASELLLHKWDYEAKHNLKDPRWNKYSVEINYRDKQAMLRQVAYFMQASSSGLSGNLISRENLENCLKLYLKTALEAPNAPSIAKLLIDQLHKRDSMLCHYGSDIYGFIHRTFLEYFCALEIKSRFKQCGSEGCLSFEQLRDDIFGKNWQDITWHEVLRLICSMIPTKNAGEIIKFLIHAKDDFEIWDDFSYVFEGEEVYVCDDNINLFLAAECLSEVKDRSEIIDVDIELYGLIKKLTEHCAPAILTLWAISNCLDQANLVSKVRTQSVTTVARTWQHHPETFSWLKTLAQFGCPGDEGEVQSKAVQELAKGWNHQLETFELIHQLTSADLTDWSGNVIRNVQIAAITELAKGWKKDLKTLPLVRKFAISSEYQNLQLTALRLLASEWRDDPETLPFITRLIQANDVWSPAQGVRILVQYWRNESEVLQFVIDYVSKIDFSENRHLRSVIKQVLMKEFLGKWKKSQGIYEFLYDCCFDNSFTTDFLKPDSKHAPRFTALKALSRHYPTSTKTIDLLRDRALNDPDEQLREWAQQQLEKIEQEE